MQHYCRNLQFHPMQRSGGEYFACDNCVTKCSTFQMVMYMSVSITTRLNWLQLTNMTVAWLPVIFSSEV